MGSNDDAVLRTGKDCSPGTGWYPLAIGDIKSNYISNLFHYVAAKNEFQGGSASLIDAGSDARRETIEVVEDASLLQ